MAEDFFRYTIDDESFIRGAARLLIAPITQAFPTEISDVIALDDANAVDDVQTIRGATGATGGTFTLGVTAGGSTQTTAGIAFDADAATVEAALELLSNIGTDEAKCTGGPLPGANVVVTFGGTLGDQLIPIMTINSAGVTGGTYTVAHTTPGSPALGKYDAQSGWVDLGATKTGIQITINNAEETFDIDQQLGIISSAPTTWECSVGTALAEATPERMQIAWEGSEVTIDSSTSSGTDEKEVGFGAPTFYTKRRLAVLYQRPSGLIRAYLFRQVQRTPQESSITHAKTGEQQSIPVRFNALADNTETDVKKQFFIIRDQQAA